MTVQEFNRAKIHDDHYVVRVLQHNTVNRYGPAQLVCTRHLHKASAGLYERDVLAATRCTVRWNAATFPVLEWKQHGIKPNDGSHWVHFQESRN